MPRTPSPRRARRQPPGPHPLSQLLDARVDDLRRLAAEALGGGDVEAVHQARVATRRLKAALDLLRPLLPDGSSRDVAKALRGLRRRLGPLRDHDVMLQHLGGMKVPAPGAAGAAWASDRLRERRAEAGSKAAKKLPPRKALARLAAWAELKPAIAAAEEGAAALLARVAPGQVRDFGARADRVARQPGADPQAPPEDGAADNVHELRVAGKLLRYTLELAGPLGFDLHKSVTRELKKLQEALGLWHDYAVLTGELLRLAVDADLPAARPELFASVLHLSRLTWACSTRHLDRFRGLWSAGGAALVEQVAGAFAAHAAHAAQPPLPLQEAPDAQPTPDVPA